MKKLDYEIKLESTSPFAIRTKSISFVPIKSMMITIEESLKERITRNKPKKFIRLKRELEIS